MIEAHFDLSRYDLKPFFDENDIEYDANDCIIRRELTAAGKSRAFINDTPVQLSMLKELGERLVDVHSQHQNLLLNKQDFQMSVLDIIADDGPQLLAYKEAYDAYQQARRQLTAMEEEIERNRQNMDFLQFQYNELANAHLTVGEQEELEQKRHNYELEPCGSTVLCIDHRMAGIGSKSCGPDLSEQYRVDEDTYRFAFLIRPERV